MGNEVTVQVKCPVQIQLSLSPEEHGSCRPSRVQSTGKPAHKEDCSGLQGLWSVKCHTASSGLLSCHRPLLGLPSQKLCEEPEQAEATEDTSYTMQKPAHRKDAFVSNAANVQVVRLSCSFLMHVVQNVSKGHMAQKMYTRRMHLSFAVCQPKFVLANAGNLFIMLFSYLPSDQSLLIAPQQAGSNAYAPAMLLFGTHGCKSRPKHAETT